jgi:hypothetical protein
VELVDLEEMVGVERVEMEEMEVMGEGEELVEVEEMVGMEEQGITLVMVELVEMGE